MLDIVLCRMLEGPTVSTARGGVRDGGASSLLDAQPRVRGPQRKGPRAGLPQAAPAPSDAGGCPAHLPEGAIRGRQELAQELEELRTAVEGARLVTDYIRSEALAERERILAADAAQGVLRLVSSRLKELADGLR